MGDCWCAHGSMRDALSLLDQAVSYGNGELKQDEVREMLGTIDRTRIVQLLQQLIAGDGAAVLDEIAQIGQLGGDYANALNGVNHALQQIAIYQVISDSSHERFGEAEQLRALAGQVDRESIQLYYQIGINGLKDLPLAPDLRSGFEMVMLRMLAFQPQISAFQSSSQSAQQTPTSTQQQPAVKSAVSEPQAVEASVSDVSPVQTSPQQAPAESSEPVQAPVPETAVENAEVALELQGVAEALQPAPVAENSAEPEQTPPAAEPVASVANEMLSELQATSDDSELDQQWLGWVNTLPLTAMVRQLAENCVLISADSNTICLQLVESCAHLRHEQREKVLAEALSNFLERKIGVDIEVADSTRLSPAIIKRQQAEAKQAAAESNIADDPMVHSMQEQFGATLVPDSVKPVL